jgi:hypothetical protein
MRKMRLDPERLAVETFAPRPDGAGRVGTVRAHDSGDGCDTDPPTNDPNVFSCNFLSCAGTCRITCGACGLTQVDPTCEGEPQCG